MKIKNYLILAASIFASLLYILSFDFISIPYFFIPKSLSIFLFIFLFLFSSQKIKLDSAVKPRDDINTAFVISALFMSGIGDIFLTIKDEKYFLCGIVAFLTAHIFYILTFVQYLKKPILLSYFQKMTIGLMLIFSIYMILLLNPNLPSFLKLPTFLYIIVLTMMISVAAMLRPFPSVIFLGALSFAISDSLLSISIFRMSFPGSFYFIWLSYYFAQFLIANGILFFNRSAPLSQIKN